MVQWWRRALVSDGQERQTVLITGKCALAATVGWLIAHDVLQAQSPAFAPFSAVLIMQVTLYQSVVQSLRYVGAVTAGVAVQAALGVLIGPHVVTFVLVTLIALAISRRPALGAQGSQVVTAAFFAYSTYVGSSGGQRIAQLGQIVLLVLIGCGVGIAVNIVVFPPMRYRSAEYGIRSLAHALHELVDDMQPALTAGELGPERTGHWRSRAQATESLIPQARSGLRTAQESLYLNPRRLVRRQWRSVTLDGYQRVLAALERTLYQISSLTRSLDQWQHSDEEDRGLHPDFLRRYGDFLASINEISRVLAALDEDTLTDQAKHLCALAKNAQKCRHSLAEHATDENLPLADPTLPYGVLVVEATRLMQEFQHTCDVLQSYVHQTEGKDATGCAGEDERA
ncbi:aromatic acid exporter family protein [Streptomyces sp. NPDC088258]|uniref:FUSC family protein n=1 Tax=Streptomyces sp. NPDC088258 TaxID=3365849 RepID=UPI0037F27E01